MSRKKRIYLDTNIRTTSSKSFCCLYSQLMLICPFLLIPHFIIVGEEVKHFTGVYVVLSVSPRIIKRTCKYLDLRGSLVMPHKPLFLPIGGRLKSDLCSPFTIKYLGRYCKSLNHNEKQRSYMEGGSLSIHCPL